MKNIIFTDGASSGNPGPSGWGAVLLFGKSIKEIGGFEKASTNNRMELTAVIMGLKTLDLELASPDDEYTKKQPAVIYTDSQYVVNGITKWVFGWQKNNWKKADGSEVLNIDLWQDLLKEVMARDITWKVIRGHAGIAGNNRADEIAVEFSQQEQRVNLYYGLIKDHPDNITEPDSSQLEIGSDRDRKKSKAYSYLSLVDGVLKRHSTWASCEGRVKGQTGAKFRKSISEEDEKNIIKDWETKK